MRRAFAVLTGLAVILFATSLLAADIVTVRVTPESQEDLNLLADYGEYAVSEIPAHRLGRSYDYTIPQTELEAFTATGMRHELVLPSRAVWSDVYYWSYQEIYDLMSSTVADHPDIAAMELLGYSTRDGVEIWALKLSDNPLIQEDEPDVSLDAVIHAREPVNTNIMAAFIQEMVAGYGSDPEITFLIDETEIWIIPILNPEGYLYVQTGIDSPWWRKNKRDNDGDDIFEGVVYEYCGSSYPSYPDGVDLNRNYDEGWTSAGSSLECSIVYRGPGPMSENESQLQQALFDREHFVAGMSFHSYSEYVGYCGDDPAGIQLCHDMAAAIPREGSGYYDAEFFYGNGQSYNWMYWEHGTQAYLVETATEFFPTGIARIADIVDANLNGIRVLLNRVHGNGLRGNVYDATTLEPLAAEVAVTGEPILNHPRMSEPVHGRYIRLLRPGIYTVSASLEGYHDAVISGLNVEGGSPIGLSIPLYPINTGTDSAPAATVALSSFPNPFNPKTTLRYVLPNDAAEVDVAIYDLGGRRIWSRSIEDQGAGPHQFDWDGRSSAGEELSSGIYFCRLMAGDHEATTKLVMAR